MGEHRAAEKERGVGGPREDHGLPPGHVVIKKKLEQLSQCEKKRRTDSDVQETC